VVPELDPAGPVVVADVAALEDALVNLVLNARDAMPSGGRLTVRSATEAGDDDAVLTVADTGSGIPPDLIDRIFMPFFSTKAEGQGASLGLASVQRAAESSGGRVEVRSKVGTGTEFRLTLPLTVPVGPRPQR
jgi:signal transduction histidine kinase